ncbi:hypothetical protein SAMN05192533_102299 [Mesobacillus persicus]|uniref:Uncharacterized protein n=1 Tax=Mesobacillus persicus TaxID=930146 RepID=A0A1H7XRB4_9BACI|nr:hypothetical protein [Mesobacillus persicus]SEM35529.1 hypothetical protein SAMN05192533_102299 [Mesobacillus persicus]
MIKESLGKYQKEYCTFQHIFLNNEGKVLKYKFKDKYVRIIHRDQMWKVQANTTLNGLKPFKTFDEAYAYLEKTIGGRL